MSQHNLKFHWKCARSGEYLGITEAHLYLPGGYRFYGFTDGSSVFFIRAGFDTQYQPHGILKISEAACWAANATLTDNQVAKQAHLPFLQDVAEKTMGKGLLATDIEMLVANQIAIGIETIDELREDKETHFDTLESVKIVSHQNFRKADSFAKLESSCRTIKAPTRHKLPEESAKSPQTPHPEYAYR